MHGLEEAEAAMGVDVETDNVSVAPPGQAELDREAELPIRPGRPMTASTMDVGLTGAIPDDQILVRARGVTKRFGGLVAVNNVDFDIPRQVDRLAHRAERRGQDDLLQHDHRGVRPDHRRDRVRRPADRRT